MSRQKLENILSLENPAARVAESRPIKNEILGHCRGRVRDAVLTGELHSGKDRSDFSPHEEGVPGESIRAERLAHKSAAPGGENRGA
jgi:hypothetical protein